MPLSRRVAAQRRQALLARALKWALATSGQALLDRARQLEGSDQILLGHLRWLEASDHIRFGKLRWYAEPALVVSAGNPRTTKSQISVICWKYQHFVHAHYQRTILEQLLWGQDKT